MIDVSIRTDLAGLVGLVDDIDRFLSEAMRRAGAATSNAVKQRMSGDKGRHPLFGVTGAAGDYLGSRSGDSRRHVTPGTDVHHVGDTFTVTVGSPDQHVAFLEAGGTITGSPMLRVPLAAAQTAAGVDRYRGVKLRSVPGFFVLRAKSDPEGKERAFLARARGKAIDLWYMLVRSVTQRGRHAFERAREDAEPQVVDEVGTGVSSAVRRANGNA